MPEKKETVTSVKRKLTEANKAKKELTANNEQLAADNAAIQEQMDKLESELDKLKEAPVPEAEIASFSKQGAPLGLPQGVNLFTDTIARRVPRELWPSFKQQIEDFKARKVFEYYKEKGQQLADNDAEAQAA